MRTRTNAWLMTVAVLVLVGCVMFAAVMTTLNWDFTKLSTVKYETNTHEISETFDSISIHTDTADIVFAFSDDGTRTVECYEETNAKHSVGVEEGTLVIRAIDNKRWYEHIGINFASTKITVYLPKAEYASLFIRESTGNVEIPENFTCKDVDVSLSTGDIRVQGVSVDSLKLSVTTGKVNLADIACKNVISSGNTGDITLKNVIAAEKFLLERSTGDVTFDGCDAAEIFVKTDTGNVMGSLLTDKVFVAQTDTGRVEVPKTVSGGRCEIVTDTGDIKITIG